MPVHSFDFDDETWDVEDKLAYLTSLENIYRNRGQLIDFAMNDRSDLIVDGIDPLVRLKQIREEIQRSLQNGEAAK